MDRVVFLDRATLPVDLPNLSFRHEWKAFDQTLPSEIVSHLDGATIAITNKVVMRQNDLSQLPSLRMIAVAATGFDCVDALWCKEKGIVVSNVPGYAQSSVADHVMMLILALRRSLVPYVKVLGEGRWQKAPHFVMTDFPLRDLKGSVLGLVGYGAIAKEVEKRAKAFGMKVLRSEHKGAGKVRTGRVPFEKVLAQADIVSLHAPLTPQTKNLIGPAELSRMKSDALLINTARGGLVEARALAEALRGQKLGGAGIDVLEKEPPREGNPLLDVALPNLIVTPHVAWTSQQALQNLVATLFGNIEAFKKGIPRNRVP